MAGSLERYYVEVENGSTELEVLCADCTAQRRLDGAWVQHAATPTAWEHPDLVCADCGAGCACATCCEAEAPDSWLDAAYEARGECDYCDYDLYYD